MTFSCEKVGMEFFDSAPTRYQARREVSATPERVFEEFLDADSWPRWAYPITAVEWTSGFPIEVGSTRTVHMRGGLVGYEEFVAYDHGVRMAFRFNEVTRRGIEAFAEDYQVTDLGSGRCAVEWTMALRSTMGSSAVAAKVSDPVMNFLLRRMLDRFAKQVSS